MTFADGRTAHRRASPAPTPTSTWPSRRGHAATSRRSSGATPRAPTAGAPVLALANPGGHGLRTTFGLVSATGPLVPRPARAADRRLDRAHRAAAARLLRRPAGRPRRPPARPQRRAPRGRADPRASPPTTRCAARRRAGRGEVRRAAAARRRARAPARGAQAARGGRPARARRAARPRRGRRLARGARGARARRPAGRRRRHAAASVDDLFERSTAAATRSPCACCAGPRSATSRCALAPGGGITPLQFVKLWARLGVDA